MSVEAAYADDVVPPRQASDGRVGSSISAPSPQATQVHEATDHRGRSIIGAWDWNTE
ncbi:hypothetical protein ACIQM4_04775 [Streptomyces sp. NPDC091272]|uniref:hypothetical protein n=1 Tax=Streptomyces sp. NPDC091272 TaxID=3365981 RepID=UPI0037F66ADD